MTKPKWKPEEKLTTVEVVTELLHQNPVYCNHKWYHPSFIANWPFIQIKRKAMMGRFRRAVRR